LWDTIGGRRLVAAIMAIADLHRNNVTSFAPIYAQ